MGKQFAAIVFGFALVAFGSSSAADEPESQPAPPPVPAQGDVGKYDLKYKFKAGEKLRSEVVHRAKVQTTIEGTTQTAETESKSIKVWIVSAVAKDGTATFEHRVENIDMWQRTTGRQEVRYNSQTDKEAPPGYDHMAEAVGVPLSTVTMDNRGKVLKRKENQSVPINITAQIAIPLPGKPLAIGESWSSPLEIEASQKDGSLKKIDTRQKFTLESVSAGVATIHVDSQILTPISDPAIEAQVIQRLSEGTVRFDLDAGRVLSQQLDLDRHVIGFSGAASSMHYVTRFTEKLLKAEQTARKAQKSAAKPAPAKRR